MKNQKNYNYSERYRTDYERYEECERNKEHARWMVIGAIVVPTITLIIATVSKMG